MELQRKSIRFYYRNKEKLVDAVGGWLPFLERDSQLIMTIKQVRSGDFSVCFVTDMSSDVTVHPMDYSCWKKPSTTSKDPTQDG